MLRICENQIPTLKSPFFGMFCILLIFNTLYILDARSAFFVFATGLSRGCNGALVVLQRRACCDAIACLLQPRESPVVKLVWLKYHEKLLFRVFIDIFFR